MADYFNGVALAIEIDLNIPAQRMDRVQDRLVVNRGYPLKLRMDNDLKLVSPTLEQWPEEHDLSNRESHADALPNGLTGRTGQKF